MQVKSDNVWKSRARLEGTGERRHAAVQGERPPQDRAGPGGGRCERRCAHTTGASDASKRSAVRIPWWTQSGTPTPR